MMDWRFQLDGRHRQSEIFRVVAGYGIPSNIRVKIPPTVEVWEV
jgi:hypothetical protein